jgi:hypothetical protein
MYAFYMHQVFVSVLCILSVAVSRNSPRGHIYSRLLVKKGSVEAKKARKWPTR